MTPAPYYEDERVTLYHGDALDLLADLGELQVRSVITDPPYASGARMEAAKSSSGAMLRAGRFHDRPIELDQMTTTGFVWLIRAVAQRCRPMLPAGGSFLCCIDWRQWSNLCGALETADYRIQMMVVWDKGSMGLGNGFRAQHELVCHASIGVPTVADKGKGNVLSHRRVPPTDHPSPKPEGLMLDLLDVVTLPGDLVLDPFAGSGTTLRAAKANGRRAIGIEFDEAHCETAARRLQETMTLDPPAGDDVLEPLALDLTDT